MTDVGRPDRWRTPRAVARVLLGGFMMVAGTAHFVAHESFLQQVPPSVPARSLIIWGTGVIEIALGAAIVVVRRHRRLLGWVLAGFLLAVFPANVYQAVSGNAAFGLDSSAARWLRLLFQPALIALALWSTAAWPRGR